MNRLHLHLLSDSTGETLEAVAKAAIALFDDVDPVKHFWPMVRSEGHLGRIMSDIGKNPGLVLFTLANTDLRAKLEEMCAAAGLPVIAPLDAVTDMLSSMLGQQKLTRPGRQHVLDAAYFARVDAIQFTIAHDDGIGWEDWEQADIVLAGVSRTSKTPTSIYLANRGLKTANIPLVPSMPIPPALENARKPLIVGLIASPERIVQIRQNRLLSLKADDSSMYVDRDSVASEVAASRRLCAKYNWPTIDVTRRSIEETAAAILDLYREHRLKFIST